MMWAWTWHRSRPFAIVHGLTFVLSIALCALPLFNLLGYEFSVAIALWMSIVVAVTTFAGLGSDAPSTASPKGAVAEELGPAKLFVRLSLINLGLLIPPLLIITLNGLRVQVCDYWGGLALYLVLPGISVLYATLTAMVAQSLVKGRKRWRGLVYAGFLLLSGAGGLTYLALEPSIVFVNPYGGYFAGSIYDEALAVPPALLAYRGLQIALIAALVSALEIAYRLRRKEGRVSFELVAVCVVSLSAVLVGHSFHVELGYSVDRQDVVAALGGVHETEHFTIYYPARGTWPDRIEELADDHEFRYWQLTEFFESEPEGEHLVSFLYPDRETKGQLMGARRTLVAKLWLGEMHLLLEGVGESLLTHEMAHLFTEPFGSGPLSLSTSYGVFPNMGWVEGIATAAQWDGREMTPHGWAAALIKVELAPDIEVILSAGGFWSRHSRTVYTLMGSFVRWLVVTRGIERFKLAYTHGEIGAAYDESIGDLVAEWRVFLDTIEVGEHELALARYYFDRPSIFGKVCARNIAERNQRVEELKAARRFDEAIGAMEGIVELDPGNPAHRHGLMVLFSKVGAFGSAHEIASDLLALEGLGAVRTLQVRKDLGDLYWREGRLEEALMVFKGILAEPGQPMSMRRALRVRILALLEPELRPTLFDYFLEDGGLAEKLASLFEARHRRPNSPVLSYLLGLRLFEARAYNDAFTEMKSAVEESVLESELEENARRIMGRAAYHSGRYEESAQAFEWLEREALLEGDRARGADWLSRVRWKQGREDEKLGVKTTLGKSESPSWRLLATRDRWRWGDAKVDGGSPFFEPHEARSWNFKETGAGCPVSK